MPLPDDRLERIMFVTRRFAELRGLVAASLGAFLVVGVLVWSLLPGDARNVFQNVAFFGASGVLWATGGIERFYDRRFGRAPLQPSGSADDPRPVMPDTLSATVLQLAVSLDMVKGFVYPGGGSLAAATLIGYSVWVLLRDWRYRPHYVVGLAAGVAGFVITWAVPLGLRVDGYRDAAVAGPYVLNYALIGIALVVTGLLDHRLLARAMQPARGENSASPGLPDVVASRARAMISGTSLLVVFAYITIGGWPEQSLLLYWALYLTLMAVAITIQRRRLKKLRAEIEPAVTPSAPAAYDPAGHLLLPIAMAGGALADVLLRGSGTPSLLALALALSHLRIALRDWPSRSYYLLGTLAASISAVHFMFVSTQQVLDWTVWFLILTSSAMLVEGFLDLRLARTGGEEHFSKEHHADAI